MQILRDAVVLDMKKWYTQRSDMQVELHRILSLIYRVCEQIEDLEKKAPLIDITHNSSGKELDVNKSVNIMVSANHDSDSSGI